MDFPMINPLYATAPPRAALGSAFAIAAPGLLGATTMRSRMRTCAPRSAGNSLTTLVLKGGVGNGLWMLICVWQAVQTDKQLSDFETRSKTAYAVVNEPGLALLDELEQRLCVQRRHPSRGISRCELYNYRLIKWWQSKIFKQDDEKVR